MKATRQKPFNFQEDWEKTKEMKKDKQKALQTLKKCIAISDFSHCTNEQYDLAVTEGKLAITSGQLNHGEWRTLWDELLTIRMKRLLKKAGGQLPAKALFKQVARSMRQPPDNRPIVPVKLMEEFGIFDPDQLLSIKNTAYFKLRDLIQDLLDTDDCQLDDHGHCQAHGWLKTANSCPHHRAKQFINSLSKYEQVTYAN